MIEINHLVKKYGSHVAVDDLSLTVEPGKIYGFLGPNGAGKSTTMNIITGYLAATSGEVKINGFDVLKQPEEAKKCVGYLPELPPLYMDMTVKEYLDFVAELKKLGMKDLVLDLQGNGGGYLNAAIDLANEFLEKQELIVYTEGRRNPRSEFFAKGTGDFRDGRLIVLVDEFSASASEIVTGAVQDWDRGVVVGRRTFGKGLVQRPIDLPDGSMIRLTVARYYTPAGRCIQKPYESIEKYNEDLIDRYNRGEMLSADSIHFPDSLKFKTHKLERTVYGGGGIMPDYFVPIDTTLYTKYHRQLRDKGVLMKVHFRQIDAHRDEWLSKYKKFDDFHKKFEVSSDMLRQLVATGKEMGVEYNEEEYQKALPLLKLQMKALIARDLWDMNEYYHVINDANESIRKALELLEQPDFEGLLKKKQ